MKHKKYLRKYKYLKKLFPDGELPFPYSEKGYPEMDVRDLWSLDMTLVGWLYERLNLYKDKAPVDLDFHKFDIDGEELTQGQCIDRMINDCKTILLEESVMVSEETEQAKDDLFKILSKVFWAMWY